MPEKPVVRQMLIRRLEQFDSARVRDASIAACEAAYRAIDWSRIVTVLSYVPIAGANEIDPAYLTDCLQNARVDKVPPLKNAPMPEETYDVIIVPVLGFRHDGYRLGRGGGWYDRLLEAQPQAVTIGLAYACTEVDFLSEPHDKRLTHMFTD